MSNENPNSQHAMAEGPPGLPASGTTGAIRRRHISPWALMALGVLLVCLAFAIIAGIAIALRPPSAPIVRGLQERTMPDGTILVLEKVTTGTKHQFEWGREQTFSDWLNGNWTQKRTATAAVPGEAIVVWFSRRDPVTGECLDVDWWLRSAAVDDTGMELDDDHAGCHCFRPHGTHGHSGPRPFAPDPPGKLDMFVAYSALRPFRHSGTNFKLRVYDTKNEMVAELDVPHTTSATLPVWVPEALPATKKAGDLDVTLAGLAVESSEYNEGPRKRTRHSIKPVLRVSRDGHLEGPQSIHEVEFEDAFGNRGNQWDCRLDFSEPAWKLKLKFWPGETGPTDSAREWSLPGLTLPEARHAELIRQKKVVEGVTVEFVAAGGGEDVVYTDSASASAGGSSSSGGSFGGSSFDIKTKTDRGVAKMTINCKFPHLLLRVTGVDPDHLLVVQVRDDMGRTVPVQQTLVSEHTVVFLQPAADVKTIDVTFIVQQPKKIEFFVKPPQIDQKSMPGQEHGK